jgi:hypothetical protein
MAVNNSHRLKISAVNFALLEDARREGTDSKRTKRCPFLVSVSTSGSAAWFLECLLANESLASEIVDVLLDDSKLYVQVVRAR